MTFDIRKIAIGVTAKMPVCDVDGNPVLDEKKKPLTITFYGPGSREFVRAKAELQNEIIEAMQGEAEAEKKKAKGGAIEPKKEVDLDAAGKRTAKLLAKLTVSLDGFDYPGGPEALYLDPTLGHVTEAADKFVISRGNFKQSSASGSASTSDTQPG